MTALQAYESRKKVLNTCPDCGKKEVYTVRLIHLNEGSMQCSSCRQAAMKREEEAAQEDRVEDARRQVQDALYEAGVQDYTAIAEAVENLIDAKLAAR